MKKLAKEVSSMTGVSESDTGLAPPNRWDLEADRHVLASEQALFVARCTKIIEPKPDDDDVMGDGDDVAIPAMGRGRRQNGSGNGGAPSLASMFGPDAPGAGQVFSDKDTKYVITLKQSGKFVVGLGQRVSPVDIEEGMRVGVNQNKYAIQIPLPPRFQYLC